MNRHFKALALASSVGMASVVASGASAASSTMPIIGMTSQPVGHYEFCQSFPEKCQAARDVGAAPMTKSLWQMLVEVNDIANTSIMPRTDEEMHGVPELWSYPTTEGDCEDFVLLKQSMLERAGLPSSVLLITVVRQPNGDGHAVLTVRTSQGDLILDNLAESVLAWTNTPYQYLKRQSASDPGSWVAIADERDILVGSVR